VRVMTGGNQLPLCTPPAFYLTPAFHTHTNFYWGCLSCFLLTGFLLGVEVHLDWTALSSREFSFLLSSRKCTYIYPLGSLHDPETRIFGQQLLRQNAEPAPSYLPHCPSSKFQSVVASDVLTSLFQLSFDPFSLAQRVGELLVISQYSSRFPDQSLSFTRYLILRYWLIVFVCGFNLIYSNLQLPPT
jgi:hypothetical protein